MGFFGIDSAPHVARNTIGRLCMHRGIPVVCDHFGGRRLLIGSVAPARPGPSWASQLNIGRADAEATKIGLARIAAFGVGYRHGCF